MKKDKRKDIWEGGKDRVRREEKKDDDLHCNIHCAQHFPV